MSVNQYKLCYAYNFFLWFTTADLEYQWLWVTEEEVK